jgi:hypothetical protein
MAAIYRPAMLVYVLGVIAYFIFNIIIKKNKAKYVLLAAAYITGAEVFFRMTKAFIFYETGKYTVILFSLIGIFYLGFKKNAYPYVLYLLLLFPGILVSYNAISFDENFRTSILFNLSGPICLSIASIYCYGKTLSFKDFLKVLDYIIYPLISMTVYIILYTPDIQSVVTGTASNSALSGGYGPNQVATVLGLGVFILLSRLLIPYKNILVHWVMMFIMATMAFRALLTFSRGGVLTAVVMSLVFIVVLYSATNLKTKAKITFKFIGVVFVTLLIWSYTIFQTGGLIQNRYANEDALGREKADITTGRTELLSTEMEAFKKSPLLGVGAGQMKYYFQEEEGIISASHNEIARMLSEHGAFGIAALFLLLLAPVITKMQGRKNIFFLPFLIFWGFTITHSAMRIAAPAFIYALCLLNIDYETKKKPTIHRE